MQTVELVIFDEIFRRLVSDDLMEALAALSCKVTIVEEKCDIASHPAVSNPDMLKVLGINPDFVDWSFTPDDYKSIAGLETIISSADNISWVDVAQAKSAGIKCVAMTELSFEYTTVAEFAMLLMLQLSRRIPELAQANYPLDYADDFINFAGKQVDEAKAGIIGLGNIGGAIAKRCQGLGMDVSYWARTKRPEQGYEFLELDHLLSTCDVVFPALVPNDDTRSLLSNEALSQLKQEAMLVSVVTGLVDYEHLTKRVHDNTLFGLGYCADGGQANSQVGNISALPNYAWATQKNMTHTYHRFVETLMTEAAAVLG